MPPSEPKVQFAVSVLVKGATAQMTVVPAEVWDAIILDLSLEDSAPDQTLRWLNSRSRFLPPVIVATATQTDEWRKASFEAGAQEFIYSQNLTASPVDALRTIVTSIWRKADSVKRYGS